MGLVAWIPGKIKAVEGNLVPINEALSKAPGQELSEKSIDHILATSCRCIEDSPFFFKFSHLFLTTLIQRALDP
ncbi:hypothetical protein PCANC_01103 [Puccinia coronata f. sp. avenae]|uniref:Uncharacterized protein n=1 Tax=Puccinia coronata f. sp. avenae TaxID=200324 RepID=A0A2N5W5W4_9BASI|nr:hypothetical protein PCANC_03192 [Puccinia coronata f. sp. avenae]PLW57636.1 hypothetical protein PCANC_01103 [Puccinia coronata f. sp. avenae]